MTKCKNKPNSRLGWYRHYANRFNKTQNPQAAHLACWYLLVSAAASFGRNVKQLQQHKEDALVLQMADYYCPY